MGNEELQIGSEKDSTNYLSLIFDIERLRITALNYKNSEKGNNKSSVSQHVGRINSAIK